MVISVYPSKKKKKKKEKRAAIRRFSSFWNWLLAGSTKCNLIENGVLMELMLFFLLFESRLAQSLPGSKKHSSSCCCCFHLHLSLSLRIPWFPDVVTWWTRDESLSDFSPAEYWSHRVLRNNRTRHHSNATVAPRPSLSLSLFLDIHFNCFWWRGGGFAGGLLYTMTMTSATTTSLLVAYWLCWCSLSLSLSTETCWSYHGMMESVPDVTAITYKHV